MTHTLDIFQNIHKHINFKRILDIQAEIKYTCIF